MMNWIKVFQDKELQKILAKTKFPFYIGSTDHIHFDNIRIVPNKKSGEPWVFTVNVLISCLRNSEIAMNMLKREKKFYMKMLKSEDIWRMAYIKENREKTNVQPLLKPRRRNNVSSTGAHLYTKFYGYNDKKGEQKHDWKPATMPLLPLQIHKP